MSEQPSPEQAPVNQISVNQTSVNQTSVNQTSVELESDPDPQDSDKKPAAPVTFQDIFSMGLFIFLLLVVVFLSWNLVQALLAKAGS